MYSCRSNQSRSEWMRECVNAWTSRRDWCELCASNRGAWRTSSMYSRGVMPDWWRGDDGDSRGDRIDDDDRLSWFDWFDWFDWLDWINQPIQRSGGCDDWNETSESIARETTISRLEASREGFARVSYVVAEVIEGSVVQQPHDRLPAAVDARQMQRSVASLDAIHQSDSSQLIGLHVSKQASKIDRSIDSESR